MSLTYGYDLKDGDKILEAPHQTTRLMAPLVLPGAALVNHVPICAISSFIPAMLECLTSTSVRHVPSWVPYFSYKPVARTVQKLSKRIRNEPIDFVKSALVCGDYTSGIRVD
jgi:hypothetical protein